MNFNQKEHTN